MLHDFRTFEISGYSWCSLSWRQAQAWVKDESCKGEAAMQLVTKHTRYFGFNEMKGWGVPWLQRSADRFAFTKLTVAVFIAVACSHYNLIVIIMLFFLHLSSRKGGTCWRAVHLLLWHSNGKAFRLWWVVMSCDGVCDCLRLWVNVDYLALPAVGFGQRKLLGRCERWLEGAAGFNTTT